MKCFLLNGMTLFKKCRTFVHYICVFIVQWLLFSLKNVIARTVCTENIPLVRWRLVLKSNKKYESFFHRYDFLQISAFLKFVEWKHLFFHNWKQKHFFNENPNFFRKMSHSAENPKELSMLVKRSVSGKSRRGFVKNKLENSRRKNNGLQKFGYSVLVHCENQILQQKIILKNLTMPKIIKERTLWAF